MILCKLTVEKSFFLYALLIRWKGVLTLQKAEGVVADPTNCIYSESALRAESIYPCPSDSLSIRMKT